jgi:hypothetical protein
MRDHSNRRRMAPCVRGPVWDRQLAEPAKEEAVEWAMGAKG